MGIYYFDTSALVKRYVLERGSDWVMNLTDKAPDHEFYTVRLTGPEMISALFRKVRVAEASTADILRSANNFRVDWQEQYHIVEITVDVADRAMSLAEKYGLRGYDAVHLAAALELQMIRSKLALPAITFVSADSEQSEAASDEDLLVINPNELD